VKIIRRRNYTGLLQRHPNAWLLPGGVRPKVEKIEKEFEKERR